MKDAKDSEKGGENPPSPHPLIFFLACLLTPWTVLGIEIPGFSILYFSFALVLMDCRFWRGQLRQKIPVRFWKFIALMGVYVAFLAFQATRPISLLANFGIPAFFTYYLYRGIRAHGITGILAGTYSAIAFGLLQFLEKLLLGTTSLDIHNLQTHFGSVGFGIAQPVGSFGKSEWLKDLPRVSGPEAEPGMFSETLFLFIPLLCASLPRSLGLYSVLLLGIFLTRSKSAIVSIAVGAALLLLNRYRKISYPVFFVLCALAYLWSADHWFSQFETAKRAYDFNTSIYMRFLGARIFEDLTWVQQWVGVGKFQICSYASTELQRATELRTGYLDFFSQKNCNLSNYSSIGSLLVDSGFIGLGIAAVWPAALANLCLNLPLNLKALLKWNALTLPLCWWYLSFLNVHYLTFTPSSYAFLAWALTRVPKKDRMAA